MTLLLLLAGAGTGTEPDPAQPVYEIAFGYTWADESPVWTDVTPYVEANMTTTVNRGRSAELNTFQTGTAAFSLINDDRRFDPLNTAGDYYGMLLPNVPVRIRPTFNGATYDLFRGFVDGWPQSYTTADNTSVVAVTASDAFKLFARLTLTEGFFTLDSATLGVLDEDRLGGGAEISEEQLSGARIDALLDLATWPDLYRDIAEGATVCQAQDTSGGALDALQTVEKSEDGFLYIEADGDVTFVGRHDRQTVTRMASSQATFSDADATYPYQDLRYRYDEQLIFNDVRRTREGGSEQSVEDATSIGRFFRSVNSETGLVMSTDPVAYDIATIVLERFREPLVRIDSLTIDPGNNRSTLYPEVLGRRILDRVTVERTPQQVGSQISQELLIQGINHQFSTAGWRTQFYVTPADSFAFFTLDSATLGVLDEDLIGA